MPLLSLEITSGQKAALGPNASHDFDELGIKLKGIVIGGLGIPDPNDWEIRRFVGDKVEASVNFTIGREYPDFPGRENFYPERETIQLVGEKVFEVINGSSFAGAEKVTMNAWKDTTYRAYEVGVVDEPIVKVPADRREKIGQYINKPRLKIFIPPEILTETGGNKEREKSSEREKLDKLAEKAIKAIAETLGIPENIEGKAEIVIIEPRDLSENQDKPPVVSLEFDCDIDHDHRIPDNVRDEAVDRVEYLLKYDEITKKYPGEIWLRQGDPEITTESPSLI
jgi:hypothetical protein